jgi:uncharacterized repeat protein (TIGR01451 family)
MGRFPVIGRLAAATAGALLVIAALGPVAILAVPPEYSIDVSKSADPATLPATGGDVEYTVEVTNTGTAFFQVVNVADSDCTLSAPEEVSGDGDAKLDPGEIWAYTCTVEDVVPPHANTVTLNACHDGSVGECNNDKHNAAGQAQATVTAATPTPAGSIAAETDSPTLPPTNTAAGTSTGADGLALVLMALAGILATALVAVPARTRRR